MHRITSLSVLALALMSSIPAAMADRIIGTCRPTAIKFAASDDSNSTSSGSYSLISGMSMNFVQGGNAPSCVIVEFQAQVHAPAAGNTVLSLDARLDDNDDDNYITGDQPQFMSNSGTFSVNNSIKFIWVNVAPGTHNVKILMRSANGGWSPVM